MIYIANPRGKSRKKKTKKSKTKRGSAGRRAKSTTKGRHGGTMAKRRKKRRVKARRKNPVRKRRVRRRVKARRRKNPIRRKRYARKRKTTSRRRRKNPRRRVKARRRKSPIRRRRKAKARRNPVRRKRYSRKRKTTRRRRRNPSKMKGLLPTKAYFKTVLGDAAGITAGYLANAGIGILLQGSASRKGLLSGALGKIANPHAKFAAQQALNVFAAFAVGAIVCKLGKGQKTKRLGENMTIGGLVRVLRSTIFYVSGVAGFALGQELLAGGGRVGGYIQQGNTDALESATMAGYLVEGGEMGAYDRDYSYDYAMG